MKHYPTLFFLSLLAGVGVWQAGVPHAQADPVNCSATSQGLLFETATIALEVCDNEPGDTNPLVGEMGFDGVVGNFSIFIADALAPPAFGSLDDPEMLVGFISVLGGGGGSR